MHSNSKITDWILISVFLALIGIAIPATIFSWDFYDVQDCRGLAEKPDIDAVSLSALPGQFESYLNDHFGFRNALVRRYNKMIKVRLCNESNNAIKCEENRWLWLKETLLDYLGHRETSKDDLERWRLVLEGRRAWLAERGICYLFVVPPNKATIYSEYLPNQIRMYKRETRLEKLLVYMKENSTVLILDLRDALFEDKNHRQVYFSTDSHWNGYGRFRGYQKLILKIKECLPEISDPLPFDITRFTLRTVVGDLFDFVDVERDAYAELAPFIRNDGLSPFSQRENTDDWVLEKLHTLRNWEKARLMQTHNPEKNLRGVLFHDSFMPGRDFLFAQHFGEFHNLWFRAEYDLLKKAVESYQPDVVIDEVQERALYGSPDDHPEWAAARKRYCSKK
ncbi:unnamed protein product [marine sediment metagenome]|uniref:AlgX/AlgJ SGNH hydrolase-like domain-containing protein n=1 Tax=marine sediment metagenome TaxID=412755 RepID=X0YGI0_9ZZZZ